MVTDTSIKIKGRKQRRGTKQDPTTRKTSTRIQELYQKSQPHKEKIKACTSTQASKPHETYHTHDRMGPQTPRSVNRGPA